MAYAENKTVLVTNADELLSALNTATGGEVIELAPGEYGDLHISPKTLKDSLGVYDSEVVIRSQDPDDPAVFNKVLVAGAQNLTFDSVSFEFHPGEGDSTVTTTLEVRDWSLDDRPAENIKVVNSLFEGTPVQEGHGGHPDDHLDVAAHGGNVEGMPTGIALRVTDTSGFTLEDSEITGFFRAAVFQESDDLIVSGNDIHGQRSDGINFAQVQRVLIEDNDIRDVTPWRHEEAVGKGDHGDLIQFWTNNTDAPSTDITIRGNLLHVSEGDASQSIFMRNEEVDRGLAGEEMYYQNILIEDNVIYNAHTHGTTVGEGYNIQIKNNTYIQNVEKGDTSQVTVPAISVAEASHDVVITDNVVPQIKQMEMHGSNGWFISNNLLTQNTDPNGDTYVGKLFLDALSGKYSSPADLQALPDGLIEQIDVGASMTQFNLFPDELTARVVQQSKEFSGNDLSHSFDARLSADSNGLVDDETTFHWDFGDGTTATGPLVNHEYLQHGEYQVTLTITQPDGSSATNTAIVRIADPLLVQLDIHKDGVDDLSDYDTEVAVVEDRHAVEQQEDGSYALRLQDGAAVMIDRGADQLYNHDQFTIDFEICRDQPDEGGGYLLYWLSSMYLTMSDDGQLAFSFVNEDEETFEVKTDAVLNDTNWHRVTLTYDANTETARIYVDGAVAAEASVTGLTDVKESWGLQVGHASKDNFDGLLRNFSMHGEALEPDEILWVTEPAPTPDVSEVQPIEQAPVEEAEPADTTASEEVSQYDTAKAQAYAEVSEAERAGADTLTGDDQDDVLFAGGDDDRVLGGAGNDFLVGEDGDDRLTGGVGVDTLYGGSGDDRLSGEVAYGEDGNDRIEANRAFGGTGDDVIKAADAVEGVVNHLDGGTGNDTISGQEGTDYILGGEGHDVLRSGAGYDTVKGGAGNDYISGNEVYGGTGNDTISGEDAPSGEVQILNGEEGDDVITGRSGDDLITGGAGNDTLKGGAGDDTLRADSEDTYLHGGDGYDILEMMEGSDTFEFSDRFLVHIEEVSFENGATDHVVIDALSDIKQAADDTLIVRGDVGDSLHLGVDLENKGQVDTEQGSFTVFSNGEQTLWVDSDMTLSL